MSSEKMSEGENKNTRIEDLGSGKSFDNLSNEAQNTYKTIIQKIHSKGKEQNRTLEDKGKILVMMASLLTRRNDFDTFNRA